jgi:8-oxo-dGTP pyrophosphatase MutT (NUDIX family)
MTTENPWTTKASRTRFENRWIRVVQNDVLNPRGNDGEYTVVHFKHRAVSVVPVSGQGQTWLVGQFRFPTNTYEWEIPAGGAHADETLLACAQRELLEETGLVADRWDLILDGLQLSNSVTDERAYTFLARDLRQETARPEETEQLALRKLPLSEAIEMAVTGQIRDAFSVVSLLKIHALSNCGELTLP